jgi:hypothetical protein
MFAQQSNYLDGHSASGQPADAQNPHPGNTIVRVGNGTRSVVETYSELASFLEDYDTLCSNSSGLVSENFTGGPGTISDCGDTVSSAGSACFGSGDLEEGFAVASGVSIGDPGNDDHVVYLPAGSIGNSIPLVGALAFVDFTIVEFPNNDVHAVGMAIWETDNPTTEVRVFDVNGALMGSFMRTGPLGSPSFFGLIADEAIGRIELEGQGSSGESIGQLKFGTCALTSSIDEDLLDQFAVYPNPASTILNVKAPDSVEINSVLLCDMLGRDTGLRSTNGRIDISSLARGSYLLRLNTSAGVVVKNVFKQ